MTLRPDTKQAGTTAVGHVSASPGLVCAGTRHARGVHSFTALVRRDFSHLLAFENNGMLIALLVLSVSTDEPSTSWVVHVPDAAGSLADARALAADLGFIVTAPELFDG